MSDRGAELTYKIRSPNRSAITPIQPLDIEISKIVSRLSGFSIGKNITIGRSRSVNHLKEATVMVRFANASPSILRLIGQRLSGLPVKLDNASTRFDGGLITGTIQLTVVGQ